MPDYENARPNAARPNAARPMVYQIRLQGHLDPRWMARFDGMTITLEDNGDTVVTGQVIDQAALHSLLRTVRDLGIPLLSVHRLYPEQTDQDTSSH